MAEQEEYTRLGRKVTDIDRAFDVAVRGVVIITTRWDDKPFGMAAAWVSRVSEQPFLAMVSVYKKNFSHDLIRKSRIYAINYLREGQQNLAVHFGMQSGRDVEKFRNVPYFTDATGAPILEDCLAYLDCEVVDEMDSGDHTIFLGEAVRGRVIGRGEALTFQRGDYEGAAASLQGPLPME